MVSAIRGLEYSLSMTEGKRLENTVQAGENTYLTAAAQWWQGYKTLDYLDQTFPRVGQHAKFRVAIHLTAPLLALFKNMESVPKIIRTALEFARKNLSTLYQITTLVCSVAMLYFGNPLFAIPSLCVLGIGYLDRKGWLPLQARQIIHASSSDLLTLTQVLIGDLFDRIFGLITLTIRALTWYANYFASKNDKRIEPLPENQLTPVVIHNFFKKRIDLRLNPKFIHISPIPQVPEIDIQNLCNHFSQINWQRHIQVLRLKLQSDRRFNAQHESFDSLPDETYIHFASENLNKFITSVKERQILNGEPRDYEKLHDYLKIIAKYVDQTDELTRTDILMRLAVEGGEYCGSGGFEVTEDIFRQIVTQDVRISLKDKILYCLQNQRNIWFRQQYLHVVRHAGVMAQILEAEDVHQYNFFVNVYAEYLGLRKVAAENDSWTVDPLTKWIFTIPSKMVAKKFWDENPISIQVEELTKLIGTPQLPKLELYDFWLDWIERQDETFNDKNRLKEELQRGSLFDRPIEIDGKMNPDFVKLTLFDMGIAEIDIKFA